MLCPGIQEVVQCMDPNGEYSLWAILSFSSLGLGVYSIRPNAKVIVLNLHSKVFTAKKESPTSRLIRRWEALQFEFRLPTPPRMAYT